MFPTWYTLFEVAKVSFLWTGKFTSICRIFSVYRLDYIFRFIDVFIYVYLPDLLCTIYLYLFSSSYFYALESFSSICGFIYILLPDLICTVHLYLFSSPYFCAVKVFHLFVEFIRSGCLLGSPGAGSCRFESWLEQIFFSFT